MCMISVFLSPVATKFRKEDIGLPYVHHSFCTVSSWQSFLPGQLRSYLIAFRRLTANASFEHRNITHADRNKDQIETEANPKQDQNITKSTLPPHEEVSGPQ